MAQKTIPPLDLMFFLTESPESPKHVGAVQVFEMPAGAPDTYLRDLVAEFKRAPVAPPFNYHPVFPRVGMPRWEVDKDMEMDYHVRHSALPKPGDNEQLMQVVQRLHGSMMDRKRPGWICQVIEGLEGNRFAIYSKIHHAYIDGMSGVKRMYGSLSTSPRDKKVVPTWSYQPGEREKKKKASDKGGSDPVKRMTKQFKGLTEAYEFLTKMGLQWLKLRDSKAQIPFNAKRTRMNRPIEWDTRSTAVCTLQLDKVKAVGKARDCTVNEVVLAVIGAALQDYLEQHHESPSAPLVALCPMSVRAAGDDTASTQVSAVHVRLGEPGAGIVERLQQVVDSSHASKNEVEGLTAEAMIDYGVIIFGLWEVLARTGIENYIAPSYNVLISNVPGPGEENMYLRGSRMVASYPISTLLPGVNLNATVLSHGNSLDFGLLGDKHALPDLEIVVQRMVARFDELHKAVVGGRKTPRKAPARKAPRNKTRAVKPKRKASPARAKAQTGARG
jgi:WS/DGAT/MGAT family acyltransferase